MRVCIHRGSKEIGGSCVEVTSGGKRLLIDLGLPLDAIDNDKKYLPDISGLDGSDEYFTENENTVMSIETSLKQCIVKTVYAEEYF